MSPAVPADPSSPPRVSIVMPVYNAMPYLVEAVESVLTQGFPDFELLVYDNGSNDGSVDAARGFKDPRIRFRANPGNLGIFGNLNRLCEDAAAPLVKILCADDVMLPGCLERQVGFMTRHPALAFSRCLGEESDYSTAKPPLCFQPRLPEVIHPAASALAFSTFGNIPGNLSNVILRRESWRRAGGFDERFPYAGDMEMWTRMAFREAFGIHSEKLVRVRQHPRQSSFLLNLRNELLPQADRVYSNCFAHLAPAHRRRMRWGFALYHGDFWVRDWVKRVALLRWSGLGALFRRRTFSVGVWWWFVCSGLGLKHFVGRRFVEGNLRRIVAANQNHASR